MEETEITIGVSQGASSDGWHKLEYIFHCDKKYQLANVFGIHKPVEGTPDHFAIGLLHHAMRARWFACRFDTSERTWLLIRDAARVAANQAGGVSQQAEESALKLFTSYMQHYSALPKPEPVACEYLLESKLNPIDAPAIKFTARLDDVSRYPEVGGKLCIGESKTTSDIAGCMEEYTLHGQPLLQAALWEVAPQGAALHGSIDGVMLDIVRKPYERKTKAGKVTVVESGFTRQFMPIQRRVLDWYVEVVRRAKMRAKMMDAHSNVQRNPASCTRMYGRMRIPCEFRELCMHGATAAGLYMMGDKPLNEWQPEYDGQKAPWD